MGCPVRQDICVTQGALDARPLFVFGKDGQALPLTGTDVVYFTVVDTTTGSPVISLTSADINEIEVITPQTGTDTGKVLIKLQPSQTAALAVSQTRYEYDAWVSVGGTEPYQIIKVSKLAVERRATIIP